MPPNTLFSIHLTRLLFPDSVFTLFQFQLADITDTILPFGIVKTLELFSPGPLLIFEAGRTIAPFPAISL
jgi:hypothetical protein